MRIDSYHFGDYSYETDKNKRLEQARQVMDMYESMYKSRPNNYNSALYKDAKQNYDRLKDTNKKSKGLVLDLTA